MKLQPSRRKFCVHHTAMHHVTSCKATELYSTSQHSITWWSDGKFCEERGGAWSSITPVQPCTTWWSGHFHAKPGGTWSSIPPVSTVSPGGQVESFVRKEAGLRALFHQSAQHHLVVRWKVCEERGGAWSSIPPVSTVSPGGQVESFVRKEAGLRALFHQSTQHHLVVRWKVL